MIANTDQLCNILGCSPRVVSKWIVAGMPVVSRGGDGRGAVSKFDTRIVITWLSDRAVARAVRGRPDARLKDAQARLAELNLARECGALVSVAEIEPLWAGAVLAARTDLLGMGPRLKAALDARYGVNVDIEMIDTEIHSSLLKLGENPPVGDENDSGMEQTDE